MPKRYTEVEIGPAPGGVSENHYTGHKALLADDAKVYRGRVPVLMMATIPMWIEAGRIHKPKEAASD